MDREEVLERIRHLNIWKKGDQRAPHKPLLILYALCSMHHKLFDRGVLTFRKTRNYWLRLKHMDLKTG